MASVFLPCDLGADWTNRIEPLLKNARDARTAEQLVDAMKRLINICNIGIDPSPPPRDPTALHGLKHWLDEVLEPQERQHYLEKTIPSMARWALALRANKAPNGFYFSLKQQEDVAEYSYKFIASIVASAFFSTYALRTPTSHCSLRDFNFNHFFKHLHLPSQQAKLRCLFRYFDYLEDVEGATEGQLLISRQVLKSENWFTIEDWAESTVPLCDLEIRHDGPMEESELEHARKKSRTAPVQVCFASKGVGCNVLKDGCNQECIQLITHPELLVILLISESLEDNEALILKGARLIGTISDPKGVAKFTPVDKPKPVTMCCIDPDDFSATPYFQYMDLNILRELNKSMLGFRQRRAPVEKSRPRPQAVARLASSGNGETTARNNHRLSPIGEQSSTQSTPTRRDKSASSGSDNGPDPSDNGTIIKDACNEFLDALSQLHAKRRAFIVLQSSREMLPVTRNSWLEAGLDPPGNRSRDDSRSSSLSNESFHSAKDQSPWMPSSSLDTDESAELPPNGCDTQVRRKSFSQRLDSARDREKQALKNGDSISLPVYPDDQQHQQQQPTDQVAARPTMVAHRAYLSEEKEEDDRRFLDRGHSMDFHLLDSPEVRMLRKSFDDLSIFDQDFVQEAKKVEEHVLWTWKRQKETMNPQDAASSCDDGHDQQVVNLTNRILKRALSESQVSTTQELGAPLYVYRPDDAQHRYKFALAVKSLSVEFYRRRSSVDGTFSRSVSRESTPGVDDGNASLAVVTGNWGCGSRYKGEYQLKLFIQWMAASMAGVPKLIYHTQGREELAKLDQIKQMLIDRKYTVGDLAIEARRYAKSVMYEASVSLRWTPSQSELEQVVDSSSRLQLNKSELDEVHSSSRLISSLFEGVMANSANL